MAGFLSKLLTLGEGKQLKHYEATAAKINGLESEMQARSDQELRALTAAFRERAQNGEDLKSLLPEAFAAVREASVRTLGLRHFDVQLIGGMALNDGQIAEMKTGEGKTLVSTLAGYLNALPGNNVHVVTVNDYLARRDSEWMGQVYRFLGMEVGLIQNGMRPDKKIPAYKADVTYGTNSEFGFDYLRDNMVTRAEARVQRGHHFAIVDEVDSILIDEARTPLIISGAGTQAAETYNKFARVMVGLVPEADFDMDEAKKTINATESGLEKIEAMLGIDDIYADPSGQLANHLQQALKAQFLFHRDVDYVVMDGEVKIVDEFTGRIMEGRRYSEGLHQALEAKERVLVREENQTLATITLQNYFRLYEKLSGMTGTAMTEESEFSEIYKLDVVEIPTNKPMIREDCPDVVYKTEKGKFNAVINDIIEHHEKGQPVLVGTITIEKSEQLSAMLKRRGIKHEVLNAKYHEKEAEIVAQAGRKGAVTIATNMAGRGTDILLGGNAEFMARAEMRRMQFSEELIGEASAYGYTDDEEILNARKTFAELNKKYKAEIAPEAEEVRKLGGLYIIGTERHESRRIDNQLRGRAGRQGDPGKSRFYISLEDDLMRLFGGDRIQTIMDRLNVDEDMPIEASILSNTIENAQKKVEGRNFAIRKNVLQYDDVMNRQREIIYEQRDRVLNGDNVKPQIMSMIDQAIEANVKRFLPENTLHDDWDLRGLRDHYLGWMVNPDELHYEGQAFEDLEQQTVIDFLKERAHKLYDLREKAFTPPIMREVERVVLLKNVDTQWMDHIDAMDELQKGIRLRAYGQQDPVIAYREEGFDMFDAMIDTIRENTARMILTVRLKTPEAPKREAVAKETGTTSSDTPAVKQPVRNNGKKPGRNDPCPCGSGKKYKKCCGRNES